MGKQIKNSLTENSESYYKYASIYEQFSLCEDAPKKVFNFLKPLLKNKKVLDIWCWSGKYISLFAPFCESIIWLDISDKLLDIAKNKTKNMKNVSFLQGSAININLEDSSVWLVYWTWFLWSIQNIENIKKILKEIDRVLAPDGIIYLIENSENGAFEDIRGRSVNPQKPTKQFNDFLLNEWFERISVLESYFLFENSSQANEIFSSIRDDKLQFSIQTNKLEHIISIFRRNK
ncbi:MAG: hypothetical protein ACD_49C00064G0032 [uncultured bacterium (gcode 4)]|uniref:Methyltransferase type 11 domain-containing protein n=1 Tax=uncultured bacterium (gcode 4) TaxID=1234023 RepID=K2BV90_9BACT|nr:MAG: hypothetical protein ACD_49C00064G0032 [uncultured bacterium (gcode 4)]